MSNKHLRRVLQGREEESKEVAGDSDDGDRALGDRGGRVNKLALLESLIENSDDEASPDSDSDTEISKQTNQLMPAKRSGNQGKGRKSRKSKKAVQDDPDILSRAITMPFNRV